MRASSSPPSKELTLADELLTEWERHIPTEFRAGESGAPVLLHVVGLERLERWKRALRAIAEALAPSPGTEQDQKEPVARVDGKADVQP